MDSLFGRQQSGEKALSRQASTESPKHSGHAPFTFKVSYGACTLPALRNCTALPHVPLPPRRVQLRRRRPGAVEGHRARPGDLPGREGDGRGQPPLRSGHRLRRAGARKHRVVRAARPLPQVPVAGGQGHHGEARDVQRDDGGVGRARGSAPAGARREDDGRRRNRRRGGGGALRWSERVLAGNTYCAEVCENLCEFQRAAVGADRELRPSSASPPFWQAHAPT